MKKIVLGFLLLVITADLSAQSAKEKAASLAMQFSKKKDKEKNKDGVKTEVHVNIVALPDIRTNESEYAGRYEVEGMYQYFILKRSPDNGWEGKFLVARSDKLLENARLKNIRIESALITAMLEYSNGGSIPFEGVFITRTENGIATRAFGISQKLAFPDGASFDKSLYRKTDK